MADKDFIKRIKLTTPQKMEYYVNIQSNKDRNKFIDRVEKIIRSSLEYRDYVSFLKENIGLDSCIFFQKVSQSTKRSHISLEMHHEPLTLYDYVDIVVTKYQDEGIPLNDLDIADEIMKLHYENKVGLVPLSKTAHEMVHNSDKLMVPLNLCYGNYSKFLEEYEPYISDDIYNKIEKKMEATEKLTPESFDAIMKQFTYLDVDGFEEPQKLAIEKSAIA